MCGKMAGLEELMDVVRDAAAERSAEKLEWGGRRISAAPGECLVNYDFMRADLNRETGTGAMSDCGRCHDAC